MDLPSAVKTARRHVAEYLDTLLVPELGFGVHRESLWEGGREFPGMVLPGTYNSTACRFLIGSWKNLAPRERTALADFLSSHQDADGAFRVPGMTEETIYYPDFEYDDLHVTNYSLGALALLGETPGRPLVFAERYTDPDTLQEWLDRRDPGSPWTEGNYLVNVGSLLAWFAGEGHPRAPAAFLRLLDWNDENQDPATGFWAHPDMDPLSGMAGAAHNLHLYYLAGRAVPRHERIVDTCLGLIRGPATTACLDVDAVDILANLHALGYRRGEIEVYLEEKLRGLLAIQNPDGGFPDALEGERTFDGWESYREPQGISNAFATWFRMTAIAMASCILYPETRPLWRFRGTLGIGYFPETPAGLGSSPAWFISAENRSSTRSGSSGGIPEDANGPEGSGILWQVPETGTSFLPPSDGLSVPRALVKALIERFLSASPAARERTAGIYRFDLGGEGRFDLEIDVTGARELDPFSAEIPGLTLAVSSTDLSLILEGKLGATAAYMRKRLKIRGDISRALALQSILKAR